MLDKADLGVEDKVKRRGESKDSPASSWCPRCHHEVWEPDPEKAPSACPDCGLAMIVTGGKAVRRGEIPGPASVRCTKCPHTAHWMARSIPAACPECGAAVEVVKGKGG